MQSGSVSISIDVAMPTFQSGPVLADTLDHLGLSEQASPVTINKLHIIDNKSSDQTTTVAEDCAKRHGWEIDITCRECSLPAARQIAIDHVSTDWFLFLDDDARISESYLTDLANTIAPQIGAIQGRKSIQTTIDTAETDSELEPQASEAHPSEWVHMRAFRGGTHATLIRHEAAASVEFPDDLDVWEDEYLRREIESNGFLWIFNHQARFAHVTQNPRRQGWAEGYVQGKYGLRPAWHVCMGVPHALVSGSSPLAATSQIVGYVAGRLKSD